MSESQHVIEIIDDSHWPFKPTSDELQSWSINALVDIPDAIEVSLRLVDLEEMQQLNATYRQKDRPTNVLSFPCAMPVTIPLSTQLLGDVVLCAPIIQQEAEEQNKSVSAHWAHLVTHGILHLLGYDHQTDHDAEQMESKEIALLKKLGIPNPYEEI